MAILSVAKIPYQKWVKFLLPLMGMWIVMGGIFVVVGQAINLIRGGVDLYERKSFSNYQ